MNFLQSGQDWKNIILHMILNLKALFSIMQNGSDKVN